MPIRCATTPGSTCRPEPTCRRPARSSTSSGCNLLVAQRLDGSLTVGDTHEYGEPFSAGLDARPESHPPCPPRSGSSPPGATDRSSLGRRLQPVHRRAPRYRERHGWRGGGEMDPAGGMTLSAIGLDTSAAARRRRGIDGPRHIRSPCWTVAARPSATTARSRPRSSMRSNSSISATTTESTVTAYVREDDGHVEDRGLPAGIRWATRRPPGPPTTRPRRRSRWSRPARSRRSTAPRRARSAPQRRHQGLPHDRILRPDPRGHHRPARVARSGRPVVVARTRYPGPALLDLALAALMRLGIDDVADLATAGDTTSDLLAGHPAGRAGGGRRPHGRTRSRHARDGAAHPHPRLDPRSPRVVAVLGAPATEPPTIEERSDTLGRGLVRGLHACRRHDGAAAPFEDPPAVDPGRPTP